MPIELRAGRLKGNVGPARKEGLAIESLHCRSGK